MIKYFPALLFFLAVTLFLPVANAASSFEHPSSYQSYMGGDYAYLKLNSRYASTAQAACNAAGNKCNAGNWWTAGSFNNGLGSCYIWGSEAGCSSSGTGGGGTQVIQYTNPSCPANSTKTSPAAGSGTPAICTANPGFVAVIDDGWKIRPVGSECTAPKEWNPDLNACLLPEIRNPTPSERPERPDPCEKLYGLTNHVLSGTEGGMWECKPLPPYGEKPQPLVIEINGGGNPSPLAQVPTHKDQCKPPPPGCKYTDDTCLDIVWATNPSRACTFDDLPEAPDDFCAYELNAQGFLRKNDSDPDCADMPQPQPVGSGASEKVTFESPDGRSVSVETGNDQPTLITESNPDPATSTTKKTTSQSSPVNSSGGGSVTGQGVEVYPGIGSQQGGTAASPVVVVGGGAGGDGSSSGGDCAEYGCARDVTFTTGLSESDRNFDSIQIGDGQTVDGQALHDTLLDQSPLEGFMNYELPAHASECPIGQFEWDGHQFMIDSHCDFVDQFRPTITALMMVFYTLIAFFILMSA